jgi:hypothetical protein
MISDLRRGRSAPKSPAVAEDPDLVQPRSLAFLVPPTTGGEP